MSEATMSGFPEFRDYDALGLAGLVRDGQVTAAELVEEAVARIKERNPAVNAVVRPLYTDARAAAAAPLPGGPFAGVPFLLKDLLCTVEGVPTSCGSRLLRDVPQTRDSEMVLRYRAAGLIFLGKTNTPEFGLLPYTEPDAFGPTNNPWDLSRTAGGSSGGSAAAVAAGMVPLASGGDGGGSIRIPASCCGLFGLKPTRGRTPTGPDVGELWRGFVQEHVLTRSVRDSAAMLDAVAGPDVGAPYWAPPSARPFLDEVPAEPGRLRVAFTSQALMGHDVHADCRRGLEETARLLEELGHEVVEAAPPVDRQAFALSFIMVLAGETRDAVASAARAAGRTLSYADFETGTSAMALLGQAYSAGDFAGALNYLHSASRRIARFFEGYDVLLTPTLARPPVPTGSLQPSALERREIALVGRLRAAWLLKLLRVVRPLADRTFDFMPYTAVFNVTGQPAMSVPLCWNEGGLPIGMQFVARFGDEATLFRLAGQLERARPWFDRVPPAFAG
jgi:amidase